MKKNDLLKLALLSLAGSLCLSAQVAYTANQELAMTKCSKPAKPPSDDETNENDANVPTDDQSDDSNGNTSRVDKQRKSAARKVIEGIGPSNTTLNVERKSAAQRSMEVETD